MGKWGYANSQLPPQKWGTEFSIADKGKKQSPIDITNTTQKSFPAFKIEYGEGDITSVENNGHSVTFLATKGNSFLSGGPLEGKYTLAQFHFHWGHQGGETGSEHTINGKHELCEMHLVHWNSTKYKSFAESLAHHDGLCVLGVFLKIDNSASNATVDAVGKGINLVREKIVKKNLGSINVSPKDLLPKDLGKFYHYQGSLTTPPLSECVQWVLFEESLAVAEKQLDHFLHIHEEDGKTACIHDNFRPTCPLHDRVVYKSC